jgi:hypothetical protein
MYLYIYIKLYTISGMFSSPMPRTGLWRGKVQTHLNKKPVGSSSTERERTAEWLNETTDHVRVSQVFLFYFRCLAERDKKADCEGERQKKTVSFDFNMFFLSIQTNKKSTKLTHPATQHLNWLHVVARWTKVLLAAYFFWNPASSIW